MHVISNKEEVTTLMISFLSHGATCHAIVDLNTCNTGVA